jgi:hypothetical protein
MIKTLAQLAESLNELYPTQYSHFTHAQKPPFICYLTDESEDSFYADDEVYVEGTLVTIEFYTKNKDLTGENKIKTMLKNNKVPYLKGPTILIESEGLFLTTFSVKLMN